MATLKLGKGYRIRFALYAEAVRALQARISSAAATMKTSVKENAGQGGVWRHIKGLAILSANEDGRAILN